VHHILTSEPSRPDRAPFVRALGLFDVVAMTVVGVVALRWVARGARIGAPSITLWLLAWLLFFLPLATAVSALSARYPEQGGIYVWTRRAFGPIHGFVCGWCLWINNLFYFPSLLLFGAANALLIFGARFQGLAESRGYSITFVLVTLWLSVGLNLVGLSKAKWLQNIGSIGTWLPAALLIACGAVALGWFGSATSFSRSALLPGGDVLGTLSLWSAICFAFSGFELTSLVGQEVRNPSRTIPLGILLAGGIVTIIYIAGSASILVAVPASSLVERSGIADAIALVSARVGLSGVGALTGGLLALSAIAMTSSWFAGAARVPFAAGVDSALPAAFARIHPRYRTPHVALIVQGVVSTLIFLVSVLLTFAGRASSIQDTYDVLVNLTILLYFVPYLYLFASFVRLGGTPGSEGGVRAPGGPAGAWLAGACGLFATGTSLALVFVPPAGTASMVNYEVNLVGQAFVLLLVGMVLFWRARARHAAHV
jgi:amino acid transporter